MNSNLSIKTKIQKYAIKIQIKLNYIKYLIETIEQKMALNNIFGLGFFIDNALIGIFSK